MNARVRAGLAAACSAAVLAGPSRLLASPLTDAADRERLRRARVTSPAPLYTDDHLLLVRGGGHVGPAPAGPGAAPREAARLPRRPDQATPEPRGGADGAPAAARGGGAGGPSLVAAIDRAEVDAYWAEADIAVRASRCRVARGGAGSSFLVGGRVLEVRPPGLQPAPARERGREPWARGAVARGAVERAYGRGRP